VAAQLGWSTWAQHHQILEWDQLPGYPQSYMEQLKVKDGQYPELGMASLSDIPSRVGRNMVSRTAGFGRLLARRHISPFWPSPAIAGALILVALGLATSFRKGGQLHDWYFLWHEIIFFVWPWDYRDRFIYAIVPLACLYLWRGAKVLREWSVERREAMGAWFLLVGSLLAVSSAAFVLKIATLPLDVEFARGDRLQPIAAVVFWAIVAVNGLVMMKFRFEGDTLAWWRRISGFVPLGLRFVAVAALTILVGSGLLHQVVWGRENLHPDITKEPFYSEIEAAQWIRAHEPSDRVIMAREQDLVFHYTRRRVVWFPPISDPKVLMDGIRRFHVGVIVVAHHPQSYWLPPEDACFQKLLNTYQSAFHLSHQGSDYGIFEIAPDPSGF